jgi:hypothetical protein
MTLPFIEPDDNIYLNLCITIILLQQLGRTKKGTVKINNERLHIYQYLVKNPVKLNQVLAVLGKDSVLISQQESYSVASISSNVDPLFDRVSLKALITILVAKKYVDVEYKKKEGFFYTLSSLGDDKATALTDNYFFEIKMLCEKLQTTLSVNLSNLNQALSQIMRRESF